jgi:hypothetical protein
MVRGSCLCGDVAWEVSTPFHLMSHCHCSMCRKAHGSAFATYVGTQAKGLRWLRGGESVGRYESSPGFHRAFCTRCGSVVPGDPAGELAFVPAGTLDADPGLRPQGHIFVGSKAPWHEITDALPRFDVYPPGIDAPELPPRPALPAAEGAVRGSCLCGGVAFALERPVEGVITQCHCSRCRKARSAAHASNLFVDLPRFRWLAGEDLLRSFKVPEAERFTQVFCRVCGSPAPRLNPQQGRAVIPAGSLDDDPGVRPTLHIFVGSKAPWHEITDALPQHAESPPGGYPPLRK